ncbi:hypothetical protein WMY93_033341 [Mugilogobius chulae]|uniref:Uncharacterized protein n=1 Tax=Mugilogobius chulae TaxID=88201 RepID=A0AAW0MIZ0_9GOBI
MNERTLLSRSRKQSTYRGSLLLHLSQWKQGRKDRPALKVQMNFLCSGGGNAEGAERSAGAGPHSIWIKASTIEKTMRRRLMGGLMLNKHTKYNKKTREDMRQAEQEAKHLYRPPALTEQISEPQAGDVLQKSRSPGT